MPSTPKKYTGGTLDDDRLVDASTPDKIKATVPQDALAEWAAAQTCPQCGNVGFRIEERLTARPIGDYSLAGAQMKFSAVAVPHIVCGLALDGPGCGVSAPGRRA
ncbi:hypothetical protein [Nocardioides sp. Leaf285]|uniref:hypothetical protein n=1 Tax=Nocardioides sp. Leaf285 TaxID=1736322 RepID=UPI0007033051|nr:hypothetical protein [Nocardioides sp. Leaf285]KQP62931.1 hypothetical protein ASF47_18130 [Nocardioides sp. Leaf285]